MTALVIAMFWAMTVQAQESQDSIESVNKAAIEREQNDARISSAEREVARPYLEVQRSPLEVSRLWCRREAEGEDVVPLVTESCRISHIFGAFRNYSYLCNVK